jgi:hypothetical protein
MNMKKTVFVLVILIIFITECKKDENSQVSFSVKNLLTLMDKSSDNIKDLSPGTINATDDDYMYYYLEDIIDGIDEAFIYYHFDDDKCNYIDIISNYLNNIDNAEALMELAEKEFGTAEQYYLSYYEDSTEIKEVTYNSSDSLWAYIDSTDINISNIDQIYGLYHYSDYYVLAGGYYFESYDSFLSLIEIGMYDKITNSKSDILSTKSTGFIKKHFPGDIRFR